MSHEGNLAGFDATTTEPAGSYDPLPDGKYVAVITDSAKKPTRKGDGQYIQLTFQVIDGEYRGRLVWATLNIDNPSEQATRIGRGQLSSICRAVGVMKPNDSSELHNIPLVIKVGAEKRNDTGEWKNVVKGYYGRDGASGDGRPAPLPSRPAPPAARPALPSARPAATSAPANRAGTPRPWER